MNVGLVRRQGLPLIPPSTGQTLKSSVSLNRMKRRQACTFLSNPPLLYPRGNIIAQSRMLQRPPQVWLVLPGKPTLPSPAPLSRSAPSLYSSAGTKRWMEFLPSQAPTQQLGGLRAPYSHVPRQHLSCPALCSLARLLEAQVGGRVSGIQRGSPTPLSLSSWR